MAARTPFAFYPSRAALDAAHRAWIAGLRPGWQAGPLEALTKPLEAHPSDWTCKALVSPYNRPSTPLAPALALQSLASEVD